MFEWNATNGSQLPFEKLLINFGEWHKLFFLLFACRDIFACMSIIFAFFQGNFKIQGRVFSVCHFQIISALRPHAQSDCFLSSFKCYRYRFEFLNYFILCCLLCQEPSQWRKTLVFWNHYNAHNWRPTCNCTNAIWHELPNLVRMISIILYWNR